MGMDNTTGKAVSMSYGNATTVDASFASTLQRVRDELEAEGFGVPTKQRHGSSGYCSGSAADPRLVCGTAQTKVASLRCADQKSRPRHR